MDGGTCGGAKRSVRAHIQVCSNQRSNKIQNVNVFFVSFRFPCGRWLGRGVDDGSTERLLVGQLVPRTVDSEELVEACRTPPRARSPSVNRPEIRPTDIQHMLGDCVNAIVKWHYRTNRERDAGSLTNLLCGEDGLVKCMESAFLYGFKSQRLFGKNLYIWDYFGMTSIDRRMATTIFDYNIDKCIPYII